MTISNKEKEEFFLDLVHRDLLKVTKLGTVYNTRTRRFIGAPAPNYVKISYLDPETNVIWKMLVHRLVWLVYRGPIDQGLVVNHRDGNKLNNRLSNLEVMTQTDNVQHAVVSGLYPSGEKLSSSVRNSVEFQSHVVRKRQRAKENRDKFESQSKRPATLNEGNSQWGTFWITDGVLNMKWSMLKGPIPELFYRGRTCK